MNKQFYYKPDPESQSLSAVRFLHKLREQKYGRRIDSLNPYTQYSTAYSQSGIATSGTTEQTSESPDVQNDNTTFVDSRETKEVSTERSSLPISLIKNKVPLTLQQFLARPILLQDGSITAVQAVGRFYNAGINTGIQNRTMFKDKLKGIYCINYTAVFTLKLNATRFQAGNVMLGFYPTGGPALNEVIRREINLTTQAQHSQCMHVKADFATDSSVTLRIPWRSFVEYHETLNPSEGVPGEVFLFLYSPLNFLTGSNEVPYSLYLHYEDVNTFGDVQAQSGITMDKKKKNVDVHTKEMLSTRPISTTLSFASNVASSLSQIPLLSTIATPISWVTDAMSRAAYFWGFSNPPVIEPVVRYVHQPNANSSNYDAKPASQTLGMSISSAVSMLSNFAGTDEDEMSIDFLKRRWSWYRAFTWDVADTDGTQLFSDDVNGIYLETSGTLQSFTPLTYLTNISRYWTGGTEFKFILSKTPFHAGRLGFVFAPLTSLTRSVPTLSTMEYNYKTIVDITGVSEVIITVPYISYQPWKENFSGLESIGILYVYVIDRLIAPGDVGTNIQVNVEVRGAPDFQIACVRDSTLYTAAPQSGMELDPETSSHVIGDLQSPEKDYMLPALCVGHIFESLKSYMNIFRVCYPITNITSTSSILLATRLYHYIGSSGAVNHRTFGPITHVPFLYSLERGGVNVTTHILGNNASIALASSVVPTPNIVNSPISTLVSTLNDVQDIANRQTMFHSTEEQVLLVNVPQNSRYKSIPITNNIMSTFGTATPTFYSPLIEFRVFGATAPTASLAFSRGMADDARYGGFVSIPLLRNTPYIT